MKYDQQLQYRTMVNKLLAKGGLFLLNVQCSCIYLTEGKKDNEKYNKYLHS